MRDHLRPRKAGVWELIADSGRDPLTGKRRQISTTSHDIKRDAEREPVLVFFLWAQYGPHDCQARCQTVPRAKQLDAGELVR